MQEHRLWLLGEPLVGELGGCWAWEFDGVSFEDEDKIIAETIASKSAPKRRKATAAGKDAIFRFLEAIHVPVEYFEPFDEDRVSFEEYQEKGRAIVRAAWYKLFSESQQASSVQ